MRQLAGGDPDTGGGGSVEGAGEPGRLAFMSPQPPHLRHPGSVILGNVTTSLGPSFHLSKWGQQHPPPPPPFRSRCKEAFGEILYPVKA